MVESDYTHMRRAFTLIELMIVLTILSILITMSMPTFKNLILKSRSEEAKAVIQSIVFAQERHKQEKGYFYPKDNSIVKNESVIAKKLKIHNQLSQSNNFNYTIEDLSGSKDGNFTIKAILRKSNWNICTTDTPSTICKEISTIDEDSWLNQYTRAEDRHYIEFQYPTRLTGTVTVDGDLIPLKEFMEGGISYRHLYDD